MPIGKQNTMLMNLFGRNYYNRSFVAGLGNNSPMNPHDRKSGADNIVAPWPGYLVGGKSCPPIKNTIEYGDIFPTILPNTTSF